MNMIHISFGGPVVKLRVGKKVEIFEMHHYCGPCKLLKDGETPAVRFWGEKNPFWPVFEKWMEHGQKVDDNGFGIIEG